MSIDVERLVKDAVRGIREMEQASPAPTQKQIERISLEDAKLLAAKVEEINLNSDPIMPKFPIPEDFGTEEQYRQKYTEKDLFDEFTQDEKHQVVMSQEAAEKK
ncbi:MAG: hypothetical protein II369_02205, partial [Clostridia bacterium]|nr:hypothetical protein [Clostridia bacterium]